MSTQMIQTADITIKPDSGLVLVNGESIRLGPVNMKVLLHLVKADGELVSRESLFNSVWKNQIISDDTLTRCISDLRNKIGKHSQSEKLIITVPKKGYQWKPRLPIVEKPTPKEEQKPASFNSLIKVAMISLLSLLILILGSLWLANHLFRDNHTPLLLIPIENQNNTARTIEDSLRTQILRTKSLRFLSKTIINQKSDFSFMANQYGVQWAVEVRIRKQEQQTKVTFSLIDVRTALELYSHPYQIMDPSTETESIVSDFIKLLEGKITN